MIVSAIKQIGVDQLSRVINTYLSLDPEMAEKISAFKGKAIAIEMQGLDKIFYMLPKEIEAGKVFMDVAESIDGEADTTLRGSPLALFKMGMTSDVAPMMLKGEIEIDGNVRLGKEFKKVLAEMDIDWEDYLSKLIGDVPAHHASELMRTFSNWSRQSRDSLMSNVSEYLQEESRDVISGAELEMFYDGVDRLRDDVDRLRARVEAIKEK